MDYLFSFTQDLILVFVLIFLSALLLFFSTKIFKIKKTTYLTALIVAAIIEIFQFISETIPYEINSLLIIALTIPLGIFLIKKFYKKDWKLTLKIWVVWYLMDLVLAVVVVLFLIILIF